MTRVTTGKTAPGNAGEWDRVALTARFGPPRPALDRGSQPVTSPRHASDYRALTHREPVSPVVVLLLILCAVLCLAAILSGPRGVLMVLVFAGTVFGLGCLLGWALARWA